MVTTDLNTSTIYIVLLVKERECGLDRKGRGGQKQSHEARNEKAAHRSFVRSFVVAVVDFVEKRFVRRWSKGRWTILPHAQ